MMWLLLIRKYWKVGVALALAAALWGHGYYTKGLACTAAASVAQASYERGMAEMARAEAELVKQARETERKHAAALAAIAEAHEQDKRDAEQTAADVVRDLRAGNLRLRQHWQGCQATSRVSGDAASAALADAAARLREKDAGEAIGDAKRADDWIKRLQDVIRSDRGK